MSKEFFLYLTIFREIFLLKYHVNAFRLDANDPGREIEICIINFFKHDPANHKWTMRSLPYRPKLRHISAYTSLPPYMGEINHQGP